MRLMMIKAKKVIEDETQKFTLCLNPQHIKSVYVCDLTGDTLIQTIDGEVFRTSVLLVDVVKMVNDALL